jgi:antitoxin component of MazEF toxin-antitoxin module
MLRAMGFVFCGYAITISSERGVIVSRKRITASENPTTLLLPQELLNKLGVDAGDEIDVSVVDRTLILRSVEEAERAQKIEAVTKSIFNRRKTAYEELAKGAE